MKNTSNNPEFVKLAKKFDRLSRQMTRTRDLDKMAQTQKEIFRTIDRMDALMHNR